MNFNIQKNNNQTEGGIRESRLLRTIVFFDMFDYPLTAWEIGKYGDVPLSEMPNCELRISNAFDDEHTPSDEMSNVECRMSNTSGDKQTPSPTAVGSASLREGNVATTGGFYFLPGREKIVETRKRRYNYSLRKLKRAKLIARIFKIIPWIKMIAVGNIIGSYNLKDESDIDLFIITEKNRIWLSRFACVLITKILNLRPTPKNSRDKICLSFFVSEDSLNFNNLMLEGSQGVGHPIGCPTPKQTDIYFIHWLAGLYSIYDLNNTWQKFYQDNSWLKNYLPNWQPGEFNNKFNAGKPWPKFYRLIIDFVFGWSEKLSKTIQLKFLAPDLRKMMNQDTCVVINDQILKLHVLDRREHYRDLYYNKLNEILKQNN